MTDRKLEGLCVYQKTNGETYYLGCSNGIAEKIVRDENNATVTQLVMNEGRLEVSASEKINESNKWQVISRMLN